ncbi:glycosyltransferase family 39 protein [Novosphingobium sp. ST904]|uniref:ArnT family glycosyltransferase n=1 Tax=Novosphingobium sp. ST904 TaxID=1684385 RepID=UPI00104905DB|nr:glycosyltransferase family 39 protein [Novosphingobium sp. ST904]TCM40664.1 dolichyl-phosphate-mannose-protein mannosyltransferase [Novosphingobium sp. ST904]
MIAIGRAAARRLAAHPGFTAGRRLGIASPLLYLAAGFVLRLAMFGKPAFQSDEQFYLLVGQRMAAGALPYVDIWDRKPYGLFLLYRSLIALPGDPVLAYQLAGLLFSVLTALAIERMARRIAPPRGAQAAGLAYLIYQPVFNVALGQSPVFYNLPVALAAMLAIGAFARRQDAALGRRGLGVMLLLGLAMQIKYSVVFEGVGLGLMLLSRGIRDGWSLPRLGATALLWAGAALAPTLAVWAGYAHTGHGEAFVQANFLSIFGRITDQKDAFAQLGKEALALIPFALAIILAPRRLSPLPASHPAILTGIRIWALSAVLGFLAFGTWYDHYLGPVLVPLCVLAAPALARSAPGERWYGRLLLGFGLLGAVIVPALQVRERGTSAEFAAASAAVSRELHGRCLYVYEGDSALYRTTRACIPTRFAYPSHLNAMNEAGALGVDPVAEVSRVLALRPGVIVVAESSRPNQPNFRTRALIRNALARSYERYEGVVIGTRKFGLYRLRR